MKNFFYLSGGLLILILTLSSLNLKAQTPGLWDGTVNNDWNEATNWDDSNVPGGLINVTIPNTATFQPIISTSGTCNDIIIQAGASLTVSGTFDCSGNMLIKCDSAHGNGAFAQADDAVITIGGNITVEKYLSKLGYHYIASPLTGLQCNQIGNFTISSGNVGVYYNPNKPPSPFPNMWRIDEVHTHNLSADQNSWYGPAKTETMAPCAGYAINRAKGTITFTMAGSDLNQGTYSPVVSREELSNDLLLNDSCLDKNGIIKGPGCVNVGTGPTNGWHLVGNPYPAPLDWNSIVDNSGVGTNINFGISIFRPSTQWTGVYGTYYYNIFTTSFTGAFDPGRYIPVSQAFFINNGYVGPGDDNPTLTFKNSYCSVVSAALVPNDFKKTTSSYNNIPSLSVYGYKNDYTQIKDKAVIMLGHNGSPVALDKLMNTDVNVPNIYSLSLNRQLSIQGISNLSEDLIIPLGFDVNSDGNYTINASDIVNFPSGTKVYLVDTKSNISQDLSLKSSYSFAIKKGDKTDRFYLKFSDKQLNNQQAANEIFNVYSNTDELTINYNNTSDGKAIVSIINVMGQVVKDDIIISSGTSKIKPCLAAGAYIVRLVTNARVYNKKVYLQ